MAVRTIVIWPDPRLRQKTTRVERFDDHLRQLYRDLCDTMFASNGLGIAAIQVGDPTAMFLVDADACQGRHAPSPPPPIAFVNPEILWLGDEKEKAEEGCLSFPDIYVPIERSLKVRARAFDLDGKPFEVEAEGLYARCVQHEHDHLSGRLLVDFVGPLKKQLIKRRLQKRETEGETPPAGRRGDGAVVG